jgi:hypothetical protein
MTEPPTKKNTDTIPVCTCSQTPRACPYHGEHPTAHDTYAQHCKEHVLGTPAHGGARCPRCDLTDRVGSPDAEPDGEPDKSVTEPLGPSVPVPNIETLRGIVRMAALTVMDDIGDFDETTGKALATAISAKASANLHEYLTSLMESNR